MSIFLINSRNYLTFIIALTVRVSFKRPTTPHQHLVRWTTWFPSQKHGFTTAGDSQNRIHVSIFINCLHYNASFKARQQYAKAIYKIYLP